jgi:hypothetical protein
VTYVRSGLTAAQVESLIIDSEGVVISAGLELIGLDLSVIEDISDDLGGGDITRDSYADLHATANLSISRPLAWGSDIVRIYYTMTDGITAARFNLGAYHVDTPEQHTAETPQTFSVVGYDMLLRLNQKVGDAFGLSVGDSILGTVESILTARGYTQYIIDQTRGAATATSPRAWPFDETTTWLTIVNDLLSSVGYRGIYADWDGRLRCETYINPADRDPEWFYTDDAATTLLGPDRTIHHDYFAVPNRWVFYLTNIAEGASPVEGAGIYTVQNDAVGDASINARGGLVVTSPIGIDAVDQAALVAAGDARVQADMDVPTTIEVPTFPNPLHWHFDRLTLLDTAAMTASDVQCTSWRLALPPDVSDMEQSWQVISH